MIDSGRAVAAVLSTLRQAKQRSRSDGLGDFAPTAQTNVKGPGTYTIGFANVDNKLYLWVDGDPVEFGQPTETEYPSLGDRIPTPADLQADRHRCRRAVPSSKSLPILKVHRDIYYIGDETRESSSQLEDIPWKLTVDASSRNIPQSRTEFFSMPAVLARPARSARPGRTNNNADVFRNARVSDIFEIAERSVLHARRQQRTQRGRAAMESSRG